MNRIVLGAAMLLACAPALAQESLLVGRVERIELLPSDTPSCSAPCPPAPPAGADGGTRVCVSNAGGCQRTTFQVERVLLGAEQPGLKDFSRRIGEFGGHDFPVVHAPLLVHVERGRVHWSELVERDGKAYFNAAPFARDVIGGVAVAALAADADGRVPLDVLQEKMRAQHQERQP